MNDNELRQRLAGLRVPPADAAATAHALQRALTALNQPAKTRSTLPWTWRDWLWPSPFAWGAIAALWIFVGVRLTNRADSNSHWPAAIEQHQAEAISPRYPLFARYQYDMLLREIQSPSRNP